MNFVIDADRFKEQQEIFTGEMTARILEHLEDAGIKESLLKELTGRIAFEVASMLDGVSSIEFDGSVSNPYLAFINEKNQDEIIHLNGNSYCHEMVYGILNALFDKKT